ncbi:thiamine pyrophosphate-binding protein [Neoroseomonas oryzicola]|uniref:Thiamine pyrophosphate-binding protein n=1 Tax=Neoroseomonas oryzicola TaxID=535904 RepID=A0A9X9WJM8_9PROT|nr:thiamine pyrophosphate-binding protein [Neoroseomonas oryzicola]MBR0660538.1 thiamine pyrophosphate-binding protein [Neoroseomonas oryzicola]NKE16780.1 thiamine pyrophosphate-binding protein [Neoroseomonas oryzicola]
MDGSSKQALMNGADIIVDHLVKQKVPYLFGLCGHGITGFMDAAFKAQNRIRTISTHHEQSAGHMADAYYKVKGEPVATFTSCGPGSANLVVALAAAMMDSSAFLAITGNVPTSQFNRGPFQESGRHFQGDFPSVVRPYVKRSFQPTRADMVPLAVTQAWDMLTSGRPGPVNLDVPLNVFVEETDVRAHGGATSRIVNAAPGNPKELTAALELLLGAKQPVIIAGQGVLIGHASDALTAFAELTGIPVVTSPNGKGAIPDRHALAFGAIGRNGAYAANDATRNADVILAIGFSFDDRATSAWLDGYTLSVPPSRLIQIDIDPSEIGRNYPAEYGILGDARASLEFLIEAARPRLNPGRSIAEWIARLDKGRQVWREYQGGLADSDQMPLRPERLMRALSRAIPEDAVVASDVGVHHNWIIQLMDTLRPRHLIHSWGFAAMGFATSGILGAKLAAPERPCVAVVGDGSFLMTPHALATAVEYDIPVVWVVWNNNGFCSIRDIQHGMFGGRELATAFEIQRSGEPYSPDFALMAKSYGVPSHRVTHAGEVEDAIQTAIKANRPYLVEVPVDRDIRPIGTGSWDLPPLPNPEPNFLKALQARGLSL